MFLYTNYDLILYNINVYWSIDPDTRTASDENYGSENNLRLRKQVVLTYLSQLNIICLSIHTDSITNCSYLEELTV